MQLLQFDSVNCKNCYKCVRHCPVKAIEVKNHQAQILASECILCGECTIVCPQNTKEPISESARLSQALAEGEAVVVSVAPSFYAYFGVSLAAFSEALSSLGFFCTAETAEGAFLVKSQYRQLIDQNPGQTWISSCCSSVNRLIAKHRPQALPYLAPVATPAQAHARLLKRRYPKALVAFISPCISKKLERYEKNSFIDFSISFEELDTMLKEAGIEFDSSAKGDAGLYQSRSFPTAGGILATLGKSDSSAYVSVSGYQSCIQAIDDIVAGQISGCFVEMSLCEGSCVGGPSFRKRNLSIARGALETQRHLPPDGNDYAPPEEKFSLQRSFVQEERLCRVLPSQEQIEATLQRMGKHSKKQELNCGMCGYNSCREKAAAIIEGKAEINMCLPFMHERAESFSHQIINITPNAILSVDTELKIQQINQSACDIFKVLPEDVMGQPISRIMDEFPFVEIMMNMTEKTEKTTFLPDYRVYLHQIFRFDRESGSVICIMKDISSDRQRKNLAMKKKIQAASMADEIGDRQMRIVHEIAMLLGETAAETKIAIHDLKETIMMDYEE